MARKKIHRNDITGEKGINLIQRVVLEMGCLWYASGGVEAGIDGYIEIRDPVSGEVTNSIVQVQSKATINPFQAETDSGFDYLCDARDIEYWLNGNAPVILVVSRPDTNEAYWAAVKERFRDLKSRSLRKIHFDKSRDRFDVNARTELIRLAIPKDAGIYLAPPPKTERLISNLLGVSKYPRYIYSATTNYREGRDFGPVLRSLCDRPRQEWVLTDKLLLSFHDLGQEPWRQLCDPGSIERNDTDNFAFAGSDEDTWTFMRLLQQALKSMFWGLHVRFDSKLKQYYFRASKDLTPRKIPYFSLEKNTSRKAFSPQFSKENPTQIICYRHNAFEGQFRRHGEGWYLEINPTYRYTTDGLTIHPRSDRFLKGMKKLENNSAIVGQVVMWANLLSRHRDRFEHTDPLLEFGELKAFEIEAGINDEAWLKREGAVTIFSNVDDAVLDDLPY